jgi:hypothetical protein
MKRLKYILVAIVTGAVVLTGCSGDNSEQEAFGDASVVVKRTGSTNIYGLNLHAFNTTKMSSATAYLKSKPTIAYTLEPYQNLLTDYIFETAPNSFTTTIPAAGDYIFKVKFFNGDTVTYTNTLAGDIVLPPELVKCSFNTTLKLVETEWKQVDNASFYNVKLYDSKGLALFVSPLFVSSRTSYSFGLNAQGWQTSNLASINTQLTLTISSYLVESGINSTLFQATGRTSTQVVCAF